MQDVSTVLNFNLQTKRSETVMQKLLSMKKSS